MRLVSRILSIIIAALLLLPTLSVIPSAKEELDGYTAYLIEKGFPEEYAKKLTELHYLHPTWEFEPLLVTEMNNKYTWSYVMSNEVEPARRSLITSGSKYAAYRHPTNTELYDSGWYQASYDTVAYFMDPRNFLNEKDIFQFQDLRFSESVTVDAVEVALKGTFMSNAELEGGKTYAEYLVEIGRELDIDPLHLAARMRQEQGASGNNPMVNGKCGDKLWYYYSNKVQTDGSKNVLSPSSGHSEDSLLAYNGLYNYFNIEAAGTGYFTICLGAMKEAAVGTAEMADAWGGSGKWDTPAKAIYGGAYKLSKKYVNDYQNTLYLQKFNVDPRSSRNFWGQYMQNIGAALSEAATIFNSAYTMKCLDLPYSFLIPVYAGMPKECPDPANGTCDTYATADSFVRTEACISLPSGDLRAADEPIYIQGLTVKEGDGTLIKGNCFATKAYYELYVSVDGGKAEPQKYIHDYDAKPEIIGFDASGAYPNTIKYDTSKLSAGEHVITIYGSLEEPGKSCPNHLIAVIRLSVEPKSSESAGATDDDINDQPTYKESPSLIKPWMIAVATVAVAAVIAAVSVNASKRRRA